MADLPDREQVFTALKRLSSALFSIGLVLVFVIVALAIAVYVFNPLMFQAVADSPRNPIADDAQVFESSTTAVGCAPDATGNASVDGYQLLGARHLAITGNVTLPDASYVITDPTIIERSNDTFVLSVETRPTNVSNRSCQGLARYTAKVQLPYGTNNYELTVRHGENRTLRITGQS
jgi:hypothetical protein